MTNSDLNHYGNLIRVKELVFCPAVLFFNHTNYRPIQLNGLMKNGQEFEKYLAENIFVESEGWLWNSPIVYQNLLLGHPDLYNPVLKKLIEVKCRKNLEIQKYDIAQAGLYANILGYPKFIIIVGYLDDDNSLVMREKSFNANPEIFSKFLEHVKRMKKQIDERKLEPETWDYCPKYAFECRNCVYKDLCEKEKEEK